MSSVPREVVLSLEALLWMAGGFLLAAWIAAWVNAWFAVKFAARGGRLLPSARERLDEARARACLDAMRARGEGAHLPPALDDGDVEL